MRWKADRPSLFERVVDCGDDFAVFAGQSSWRTMSWSRLRCRISSCCPWTSSTSMKRYKHFTEVCQVEDVHGEASAHSFSKDKIAHLADRHQQGTNRLLGPLAATSLSSRSSMAFSGREWRDSVQPRSSRRWRHKLLGLPICLCRLLADA